jgi:hypothetical protein
MLLPPNLQEVAVCLSSTHQVYIPVLKNMLNYMSGTGLTVEYSVRHPSITLGNFQMYLGHTSSVKELSGVHVGVKHPMHLTFKGSILRGVCKGHIICQVMLKPISEDEDANVYAGATLKQPVFLAVGLKIKRTGSIEATAQLVTFLDHVHPTAVKSHEKFFRRFLKGLLDVDDCTSTYTLGKTLSIRVEMQRHMKPTRKLSICLIEPAMLTSEHSHQYNHRSENLSCVMIFPPDGIG